MPRDSDAKDRVPLVETLSTANRNFSNTLGTHRILIKYLSLTTIVVQTTVMVLLLRYSKTQKVRTVYKHVICNWLHIIVWLIPSIIVILWSITSWIVITLKWLWIQKRIERRMKCFITDYDCLKGTVRDTTIHINNFEKRWYFTFFRWKNLFHYLFLWRYFN